MDNQFLAVLGIGAWYETVQCPLFGEELYLADISNIGRCILTLFYYRRWVIYVLCLKVLYGRFNLLIDVLSQYTCLNNILHNDDLYKNKFASDEMFSYQLIASQKFMLAH